MDTRFQVSRLRRWFSVCCILIVFFHPKISQASRITLDLSVEVIKEDATWSGHILIKNRGDEAAYDLQASLEVLGKESRSSVARQLEVEKTWEATLPILEGMASQILPGRYPVTLRVSYSDSNGHPFSALAVNLFEIQEAVLSEITGSLSATPVSNTGKLILEIKNTDKTPIEVSLHWVFPRELVSNKSEQIVRVNGKDSMTVTTRVRNLSALPGSQYPVFAIMEYEKDGRHFSTKAMAALDIIQPVSFIRSMRIPLLVLIGILVVMVIILQVRHRRSAKCT